jgi:hypothetical protein
MTGLTLDLWINLTTADSYAVLLTIGEQSSADPVGTRHITRTESFVTGDGIRSRSTHLPHKACMERTILHGTLTITSGQLTQP